MGILFVVVTTFSCSTNVVNLQEIELIGAIVKNPIKIVEDKKRGDIDFNFNLSINNKEKFTDEAKGHTTVNENNIYEIESVPGKEYYLEYAGKNTYKYKGDNLIWKIPKFNTSVDVDIAISKNFAFTFGTKISGYSDENLFGHNFGFAYFNKKDNWAYRFDTFLRYQEFFYDMTYVKAEDITLSGNKSRKVYLYNKSNKDSYYNMGFLLSLNSTYKDWPINIFVNYAFGWQTFYEISVRNFFNRSREDEFEHEEYYHSFSLGIYQNTFDFGRILIGYTLTNYEHSNKNFFIPSAFVQYDISLF